jgi:hypothetical protein
MAHPLLSSDGQAACVTLLVAEASAVVAVPASVGFGLHQISVHWETPQVLHSQT